MASYYNNPHAQTYSSSPNGQTLQFFSPGMNPGMNPPQTPQSFYQGRPSLDPQSRSEITGNIGAITSNNPNAVVVMNWWNAFTPWTGMEGETPLLEELGINFDHILQKSLTVLNPFSQVETTLMDDADLAGPLVFCFVFAMILLFSGKPQFSFIYGIALVGSISIYVLLNLMSEAGIDFSRTASVLGYCLLPLVLLSLVNLIYTLDGTFGYVLSCVTIVWCSYSASTIFSSVLRLLSQKALVMYPVALVYAAFSLVSIFDA